jgi:hypothetical protein
MGLSLYSNKCGVWCLPELVPLAGLGEGHNDVGDAGPNIGPHDHGNGLAHRRTCGGTIAWHSQLKGIAARDLSALVSMGILIRIQIHHSILGQGGFRSGVFITKKRENFAVFFSFKIFP